MATASESLQHEAHVDPDAQATVTDFLDYTEYLPADLIRSLTLIGKLDGSYLSSTTRIHNLLSSYGNLTHSTTNKKHVPQELRKEISYYLEHALNARESAYAESSRLYDEVDRHYNRLASVKSKLLALPKPPSRDPTPVPIQHSPQANRARLGRAEENGGTPPPRITLRLGNANAASHNGASHKPRHRIRRITVPGEVLPPPNPDSPPSITDSDWESRSPSPIPMPTSRVGAPIRSRSIKPHHIKIPKAPKPPRARIPKVARPPRPPRPPGAMGTNVHSAVAGISTSNALSLLTPPPADAKPGTVHAPWMRLTEWEMARLRKRMKKNAIWTPSETMIRRELSEAGRGPENYRKTRSRAEETAEEFIDCDNIATTAPGKQLVPGEISADSLGFESKLSNKGMKLNEAKKLKRELLAREQAAIAAAEAEQAAKRLGDIGSSFKNLFDKPNTTPLATSSNSSYAPLHTSEKAKTKPPKKRKIETTPKSEESQIQAQLHSEIVSSPNKPSTKKRRTEKSSTGVTTTTTVPLAAPAPSPIKPSKPPSVPASPTISKKPAAATTAAVAAAASRSRRPSLTLRGPAPPSEPVPAPSRPASHPPSRHASAAPPAEPTPIAREHVKRKSATPAPIAPMVTAASRRSKRPAPGPVTSSQDGGAAVSVGRRKNAPRQRGTAAAASAAKKAAEGSAKEKEEETKLEEEAAGEEIDPNEPRYCLCGDVSFGTMICCENPDCEKEWFHLDCVGLQEPPGRRVKWYCPDCRTKAGKK